MTDRSAVAVAPHLFRSVPYDVARDFAPITLAALSPSLLVANSTVPADDFSGFLGYARSQSGGILFASAGPGTNPHVALELFKLATGTNVMPVHYKGGGASATAMVSGEVKAGFGTVPVLLPHVKAGRLRALLVTGTQRFAGTPQVPTAGEVGVQGLELEFWIGLLAPARTPPEIIAQVNRLVAEIMRSPELQTTLVTNGAYDLVFLDSERAEYPHWWPDVRRTLGAGGLLVVDNAASHADELAPFMDLVKSDAAFSTCLVPVGKGEFLATKVAGRATRS